MIYYDYFTLSYPAAVRTLFTVVKNTMFYMDSDIVISNYFVL